MGDTSVSTNSDFTDNEWTDPRVKEHVPRPPQGLGVRKRKKSETLPQDDTGVAEGVASLQPVETLEATPLVKRKRLVSLSSALTPKLEPPQGSSPAGPSPSGPSPSSGPSPGLLPSPRSSELPFSALTPDRPRKKRIPYTLVEASKGNRCPTEGCDGHGHITGMYEMHFAVSGCPKAHGKTAEECKARREELNRLRSKTLSSQGEGEESGAVKGVFLGERSLRRTQRSTVEDIVHGRGHAASLSMTRKMQSQQVK